MDIRIVHCRVASLADHLIVDATDFKLCDLFELGQVAHERFNSPVLR